MRDLGAVLDHEGPMPPSGMRSSAVDHGRQGRAVIARAAALLQRRDIDDAENEQYGDNPPGDPRR
jgi:hypothetical protein